MDEPLSKDYIIEDISSDEIYIRVEAWKRIDSFLSKKIITIKEIRDLRFKLIELLGSYKDNIRKDAWSAFNFLITRKFKLKEDSSKFIDLLSSREHNIRVDAWMEAYYLI